jgi:predicted nucleic acid-binding protein
VSIAVLDSSVGAKWFLDEPGSVDSRALLAAHGRGDLSIVVPSLFVYEVFAVAARVLAPAAADELWERFLSWRIHVRELDAALMPAALAVQRRLGCSLYDAVAPAVAEQAGATLYSADARAHARWPGVVLLG